MGVPHQRLGNTRNSAYDRNTLGKGFGRRIIRSHPSVAMNASQFKMSIEEARDKIKASNLRCTSYRVALLQYVAETPAPVSHS